MKKSFRALFLDKESRTLLKTFFPPTFEKVFGDHITLEQDVSDSREHFRASARVIGFMKDGQCEALMVELDNNAASLFKGSMAHVTLSCSKDTEPAHSKNLSQFNQPLSFNLVLMGTVRLNSEK